MDDGSPDHTGALLDEMATQLPWLKVVHHEQNRGYGGALRTGFATASKELVFYTDGDAQYDPRELDEALRGLRARRGLRERLQDRPLRPAAPDRDRPRVPLVRDARSSACGCATWTATSGSCGGSVFDKVVLTRSSGRDLRRAHEEGAGPRLPHRPGAGAPLPPHATARASSSTSRAWRARSSTSCGCGSSSWCASASTCSRGRGGGRRARARRVTKR